MTDARSPAVAGVAMAMMQKEKEVRLWFFIPTKYSELFMLTVLLQLEDMRRQMALLQAQLQQAQSSDTV